MYICIYLYTYQLSRLHPRDSGLAGTDLNRSFVASGFCSLTRIFSWSHIGHLLEPRCLFKAEQDSTSWDIPSKGNNEKRRKRRGAFYWLLVAGKKQREGYRIAGERPMFLPLTLHLPGFSWTLEKGGYFLLWWKSWRPRSQWWYSIASQVIG